MSANDNHHHNYLRKFFVAWAHVKSISKRFVSNLGERRRLDSIYLKSLARAPKNFDGVILADGLWDNPNHFFRLFLYLSALDESRKMQRVAFVRNRGSGPQKRTLKALGFTKFIKVSDLPQEKFLQEASEILRNITTHKELLDIQLPGNLPAYIFYDDALKRARHPQPNLSDPCWKLALAQAMSASAQMNNVLNSEDVRHVVLSHPWGLPYGAMAWAAISQKIVTCHLTGYAEGIRIRRFSSLDDFATPVEHLTYKEFKNLSTEQKAKLISIGHGEFKRRITGQTSDINSRYAFNEQLRQDSLVTRKQLIGDDSRPIVLICAHVWFDFPHTFAMRNFTDFLDWMQFTIAQIVNIKNVIWLLKPHPTEKWYGGFQLSQLVPKGLEHIITLAHDFDQATALDLCDAVVTCHGTAGIEAGIFGRPVLSADRNYYSEWPFVISAHSRDQYGQLLGNISQMPRTSTETTKAAIAFFSAALSQPSENDQRIRLHCDSFGTILYKELKVEFLQNKEGIEEEIARIKLWCTTKSGSYATYQIISSLLEMAD